jgi:hypothetical protein
MVDTSTKPATGYMESVPDRTARTLLPIIEDYTLPGTTVHSDEWRAYSMVQSLQTITQHNAVNHSVNFVDPQTGVH